MRTHKVSIALGIISVTLVIALALSLAVYATNNDAFAERVVSLGYAGIVIAAYISGLNLIVPIPTAAFVPMFTSTGFALSTVIALMVVGTVLADLTAYGIGYHGRRVLRIQETNGYRRIETLVHKHNRLVLPFLFVYAAIMPLPNELVVIPLSLLGYRAIVLLVPLILGTIIHISLFALGIESLFSLLVHSLGL